VYLPVLLYLSLIKGLFFSRQVSPSQWSSPTNLGKLVQTTQYTFTVKVKNWIFINIPAADFMFPPQRESISTVHKFTMRHSIQAAGAPWTPS
jgi:hypothetical protein